MLDKLYVILLSYFFQWIIFNFFDGVSNVLKIFSLYSIKNVKYLSRLTLIFKFKYLIEILVQIFVLFF